MALEAIQTAYKGCPSSHLLSASSTSASNLSLKEERSDLDAQCTEPNLSGKDQEKLILGLHAHIFDALPCEYLPGSCKNVPGGWKRPVGGSDIGSAYTFSGRPAVSRAPQHLQHPEAHAWPALVNAHMMVTSQRSAPHGL